MIYLTVLKRRWLRIEVSSIEAHVLDTSLNRALVDILIFLSSRFIVCAKTNNKMFKNTVFLIMTEIIVEVNLIKKNKNVATN